MSKEDKGEPMSFLTVKVLSLDELLSAAKDSVELSQKCEDVQDLKPVELLALNWVKAKFKFT